MMGRAERAPVRKAAIGQFAGDRGDHRYFQQLLRRKRRQDRRQPLRQHGFPRAGRPHHQKVMIH